MKVIVCVCFLLAVASGQTYEHLTITADSLVVPLAPLCSLVESQLGLNDTVVTVSQVYASVPGRDNPEKIRNFIKQAYTDWGVTHVLLAADHDQIPCRLCWVEISQEWRDWIPTELYYSALDGDWDGDGDSRFGEPEDLVDLLPDVYLGRIPLATPGEIDAFVERFLVYAQDSTAAYLEDVLLAGFDFSQTFRGEDICEIYDTLLRPETMRSWKVYDSHSGNHEDLVKALLDQGMNIWVQYDHCGYNVMGCGYINHNWLLLWYELEAMANAPRYSIMLAAGCLPSAFDSSFCVSEVLLTAPNGGCVATCANSRVGFGASPDPYRCGSVFYVEKCLEWLWTRGRHSSLEGIASAHAQGAPFVASSMVWRWCHYEFLLCGEPSMPVWVPQGSGVEEGDTPDARRRMPYTGPTVVRGVLVLPVAGMRGAQAPMVMLDAAGRDVVELQPGANDVSHVPAGVYFVSQPSSAGGHLPAVSKVVIQR